MWKILGIGQKAPIRYVGGSKKKKWGEIVVNLLWWGKYRKPAGRTLAYRAYKTLNNVCIM